jgi:hypothetical protein
MLLLIELCVFVIVCYVLCTLVLFTQKITNFKGVPSNIIARDMTVLIVCTPGILQSLYLRVSSFQPDYELERQVSGVFMFVFVLHVFAVGRRDLNQVLPSLLFHMTSFVLVNVLDVQHTVVRMAIASMLLFMATLLIQIFFLSALTRNISEYVHKLFVLTGKITMIGLILWSSMEVNRIDFLLVVPLLTFVTLYYQLNEQDDSSSNVALMSIGPVPRARLNNANVYQQLTDDTSFVVKTAEVTINKVEEEEDKVAENVAEKIVEVKTERPVTKKKISHPKLKPKFKS